MEPTDSQGEAVVMQAVALYATLTAAAGVEVARLERRQGRDLSADEAAGVVRPALLAEQAALADVLLRLQMSLVHPHRGAEGALARLVRRFDELVKRQQAERLLHRLHQQLLSLYPAISAEMVEAARQAAAEAARLADPEDEAPRWTAFTEAGLRLTARLRDELSASSAF